ncbi:MAG: molybdenum cofactor guanylyltransferase [Acidobacteria bacterium]|nr:molybdenum cofactor guanylyltransferase [Acidobacteriota bacterium]
MSQIEAEIEGFILAGGASSRMGTDKARLRLDGRTFVELVADALRPLNGRVSVVSSRPDAKTFGLAVVPDMHESLGALGGLHAALRACEGRWAAVVSCDLPFVTGALMLRLASFLCDETEAVAPLQDDGRAQPLCAVYARAACLGVAEDLIRAGELRPRRLLRRVRTRWVSFDELSDLKGSELFFTNVNTPEDYARAQQASRGANQTATVGDP